VVTNSGIEGNYTLATRYFHPNWSNLGWLEYAKPLLIGKSVLGLPALTSQWEPSKRRFGQSSYASAIDNCLWDILGRRSICRYTGSWAPTGIGFALMRVPSTSTQWTTSSRIGACQRRGLHSI